MGWIVGAVINVIGSICINLGTNITKLGHNRTAAAAPLEPPRITKHPRAWLAFPGKKSFLAGMTIFATGNVLNFASFGFAAQSLLAALGVVQFLSNMVFARFLNHEHITKRVMVATGLVVTGCILLVSFGNHDSPIITAHELLKLYSKGPYIAYLCVMATIVVTAYFTYRKGKEKIGGLKVQRAIHGKWGRWLPVCYALFSGLLGTQSVLYGKTLSMLLRTTVNGDSQLGFWYTWLALVLFIFFAAFWLTRYSKALRLFPVSIIMPILQIVWVLFSIVSGSLYYQEYKTLNALSGGMFAAGVVIMLIGIGFLTSAHHTTEPEEELLEAEMAEQLVAEGASGANTPTTGKLLEEAPPLRGSLRQKYSSGAAEAGGAAGEGDGAPAAVPAGLGQLPARSGHTRQASDDVGLRLFAGESSSAAVWDGSEGAQQAGEVPQLGAARVAKRPALRVVVEAGAGDEVSPTATSEGRHSVLEDNDMDTNFKQFAMGFAGLDLLNPLSPAFTSFSMPLVPAVGPLPRLSAGGVPLSARGGVPLSARGGLPLSARGTRTLSPVRTSRDSGSAGAPRGKHRIQRSRSAGELSEMMIKAAAQEAEEVASAAPPSPSQLQQQQQAGRSGPGAATPKHSPGRHMSMPPMRGSPFDGPTAATPTGATASVTSPASPAPTMLLGRDAGGSAPRLASLGSGGTRRSWSMMSERGTPVPSTLFGLETPSSMGDPSDAPASTSSTKPPRINPLSPRAFLEDLDEEVGMEELLQKASKHD